MVAPFQAVSCIILHSRCSRYTAEAEVVNKPKKMSYSDSNNNKNNNIQSNTNSSRQRKSNSYLLRKVNLVVVVAIWSIMTLAGLTLVHGAAVYSNADFLAKSAFEQICNDQEEHFIECDGRQSSVIIEFNPNVLTDKRKSCTRILSAPFNYGFIVRLILPKYQHHQLAEHNTKASQRGIDFDDGVDNDAASIDDIDDADVMNVLLNDAEHSEREKPMKPATKSALTEMTTLIEKLNATVALKNILGRSCPLQVFSSLDPHTPQWRLDPCQLEDAAPEMDDPVRLMHGRVRIVWEHSGHTLKSKLMITALGKGEQCRAANKHPCLKIGEEPLLCISQDLVCDGIRHCPNSNEYNSDEDYGLCWRRKHVGEPLPTHIESVLFEHFALEVFRNLFLFDVTYPPGRDKKQQHGVKHKGETATLPQGLNVTTLRKVNGTVLSGNDTLLVDLTLKENMDNGTTTVATTPGQRRNNTRHSLHTDLSKYGPWGYLMLGMLLCGGALLICGLWASASQQAAQNERESALANAAAANGISIDHSSAATSPPNYEELDPPPAYSVLFPNQKTASTATLSAMPGAAEAAGTTPLSPSSRPACSGVAGLALRTTIAQALSTTTNTSSAAATTASTAPPEASSTAGSSSQDSSQLPN